MTSSVARGDRSRLDHSFTLASRPPDATTPPPAIIPNDSTSIAPECASLTAVEQFRPLHMHRPPPAVPETILGGHGGDDDGDDDEVLPPRTAVGEEGKQARFHN